MSEERKDFYVYTLAYPDGSVFYVGKGSGNRIKNHELEARRGEQSPKCDVIRQIWSAGNEVVITKVTEYLSGREAGLAEWRLIQHYGLDNLTNQTSGGEGASFLKRDEERRIPVSFSLSGDVLRCFREAYSLAEGHEPTAEECREKAKDLAYQSLDAYIKQHIELDGAIII